MADQNQVPPPPEGAELETGVPPPPEGARLEQESPFANQSVSAREVPERELGPAGARPLNVLGFSQGPSRAQLAEAGGFDPDAKPVSIKTRIGARVDDAKVALAKDFDTDPDDMDVGHVPGLGIVFLNPETDGYQLLNPVGFDLGDLADVAIEAPVIIGEILGGILGVRGGPAGVTAGGAAGAAAGSVARDEILRALGITDPTAEDMAKGAALEGAIALAGFGAGRGLRGAAEAVSPKKRALKNLEDAGLTPEKLAKARAGTEDLEASTRANLSAGQRLAASEETEGLGARLRATELQDPVASGDLARQQSQQDARRKLARDVAPRSQVDEVEVGEGIRQASELKRLGEIDRVVQISRREQDRLSAELDSIAGASPKKVGGSIRKKLQEGRDKVFKEMSEDYDAVWSTVPENTRVNVEEFRKLGEKWDQRLKQFVLPSLVPEDKKVVESALRSGLEKVDGRIEDVGKTIQGVSDTLSVLKARSRALATKTDTEGVKQKKLIDDLAGELQTARGNALAKLDKDTARRILDLDHKWAAAKQNIDEALVGNILRRQSAASYRLADDEIVQKIIRNDSEFEHYMSVASDYPELNALDDLRNAMKGKYTRDVVRGSQNHDSWVEDNEAVLKGLFDRSEMRKFESARRAQDMIKMTAKNEQALIKELKDEWAYGLDRYDPEAVVRVVEGKHTRAAKLKNLLKNDPTKWEAYQDVRRKQIVERLEDADGGESLSVLSGLQKGPTRREIEITLGPKYINQLKRFRDLARIQRVGRGGVPLTTGVEESADNVFGFGRQMLFGPLTRTGFRYHLLGRFTRARADQALREILSDPDKLETLMAVRNLKKPTQKWVDLMTAVGLGTTAKLAVAEDQNAE